MDILLIASNDPRKRLHGGQQRTHAVWKGLKTLGNVWTIVPVQHKCDEESNDDDHIYKVYLEERYSLGWFVQRLWAKVFPCLTLPLGIKLPGKDGRCEIRVLQNVKFDITVVRFNYAGRLCPWRIAPMFIDVDDVPTDDYRRAHPSHRIRLWLLHIWQDYICKKARQLWIPDPKEKGMLPNVNIAYVPNIPMIDTICVQKADVHDEAQWFNTMLFVGFLAHVPNQVALDWFLKTYWSDLKMRLPSLKYRIAGGGLPERLKDEWSQYKDVELLGFVDDLNEVYASGCAVLMPMRIGSGTCLKTLEALAYGKPIISTSQGLRGIPRQDRTRANGMYEFRSIDDICSIIKYLQKSGAACQESSASRAYVDKNFSQEVVNRNLSKAVASAAFRK